MKVTLAVIFLAGLVAAIAGGVAASNQKRRSRGGQAVNFGTVSLLFEVSTTITPPTGMQGEWGCNSVLGSEQARERYRGVLTSAYAAWLSLGPGGVDVKSAACSRADGAPPGAAGPILIRTRFSAEVPSDPPDLVDQAVDKVMRGSQMVLTSAMISDLGFRAGVQVSVPRRLDAGALPPLIRGPDPPASGMEVSLAPSGPYGQIAYEAEQAPAPSWQPPSGPSPGARQQQPKAAPQGEPGGTQRASAPPQGQLLQGWSAAVIRDPYWAGNERCSTAPDQGTKVVRDSAGRLWGWERGRSCAYKDEDDIPAAMEDAQ